MFPGPAKSRVSTSENPAYRRQGAKSRRCWLLSAARKHLFVGSQSGNLAKLMIQTHTGQTADRFLGNQLVSPLADSE